jgi:hypothetical protein
LHDAKDLALQIIPQEKKLFSRRILRVHGNRNLQDYFILPRDVKKKIFRMNCSSKHPYAVHDSCTLSADSFPRVWFFHRERHAFSEQVCGKNMLSLFCFL